MSLDPSRYLDMQRARYAELVARSDFGRGSFEHRDDAEHVVGSYARHEAFDYERWLFGGLDIAPSAVALEYGCGPGRMLLRLAPRFRRVDGADISPEVLEVARRRVSHLPRAPRLMVTNGTGLPPACDGKYDVALSVICLQHICVYSIRRRILEALYRCLKPGGLLTFQMGYGPGHPALIGYADDALDAQGTNGAADVTVLHPGEIAEDLAGIGFATAAYALTPTGPGDTHAAWIFVRALKPGRGAAVSAPGGLQAGDFRALAPDAEAVERARLVHRVHSIRARHVELQRRARDLEIERDWAGDVAAVARSERDVWHRRALEFERERENLRRRAEAVERQLRRLRVADRHRVRTLIAEVARSAEERRLRVGVFGAGAHTEWLCRETVLQAIPSLFLFDSDPALWGQSVAGIEVRPVHDIPAMGLNVVIISSLAFQDEMAGYVESLQLPSMQIVRCYP